MNKDLFEKLYDEIEQIMYKLELTMSRTIKEDDSYSYVYNEKERNDMQKIYSKMEKQLDKLQKLINELFEEE